jgi:multicomponent Na+:H+ antiporter subunit G
MNAFAAVPLFAGVLVVIAAAIGMVRARDLVSRLHFLTPVTTLGGPLIGLGLIIANGINLGSAVTALTVVLLAVTGPVLQSATARLKADP